MMKKRRFWMSLLTVGLLTAGSFDLRAVDTMSDTWAAEDALGRTLLLEDTAPAPRDGKYVVEFYYIWHGAHNGPMPAGQGIVPIDQVDPNCPYDNSLILWILRDSVNGVHAMPIIIGDSLSMVIMWRMMNG